MNKLKILSDYLKSAGLTKESSEALNLSNNMLQEAIAYFGTTYNPNEAGYILPNGDMLDFSGKREGGTEGSRAEDHRAVERFVNEKFDNRSDAMDYFMQQTGAIRISFWGDYGLIDLETKPTPDQTSVLQRIIMRKSQVDLSLPGNSEVEEYSFEFDRSERSRLMNRLKEVG